MENKGSKERKGFKFPLYITKKMDLAPWKYWLIRGIGILLAFLIAGIVCTILKPGTFGIFFSEMIRGCFDFSDITTIIDLLVLFSTLLMISLALIPAFKMKFWNIGAEGQILVGCMVSAGIAKFAPSDMPNIVILVLCALGAVVAGVIWSVIPAIFKALFNTNETLFTLMMNYIATLLGSFAVSLWIKGGSHSFGVLKQGTFSEIFGNTGTLTIVFAAIIFAFMFFYIKKSIHGYELTVVGESINTARYIGINVKKVVIRTMIFTGAIMGFIGFLIVCSIETTFNETIVGGKGFTGVLIAWLGHFDPFEVALFSFLAAVMNQGTTTAATAVKMSSDQFSAICTGIFFFVIISCEFFSNYQIKIHTDKEFDDFYVPQKNARIEAAFRTPNIFLKILMIAFIYITYPFFWISCKIAYSKNKKAMERVEDK